MAKIGRKQKPYETSDGITIPGLARQVDGRWRVISSGFRFTEPDEQRAIEHYKKLTNQAGATINLPIATMEDGPDGLANWREKMKELGRATSTMTVSVDNGQVRADQPVPEAAFWLCVRDVLLKRPDYAARMTGIPELANLHRMGIPKDTISITRLVENYRQNSPSKSRERTADIFKDVARVIGAKTLDDLSIETLSAFRQKTEAKSSNGNAKRWTYGQVKAVISFGLRTGLDPVQIRAAMDRCRILWTGDKVAAPNPRPISRKDFQKLLAAGKDVWRAWLLAGLNMCLHLGEVCDLRWDTIDLDNGTHAAIRSKTNVVRAAVLWKETIDSLQKVPRRGPWVFTSTHGVRYNRNSRGNMFGELRIRAGVSEEVTFDSLRDAAYSAAVNDPTVEERFARVLAGHRSQALQDNYVLRNPRCTEGACLAVYRAFGPFA